MSSAFGSYDGVPRWLIDRLPPAKHKYPWPFRVKIPEELWAFGYLTEAVSVAFQQLYDNVSGARDAMVEFWTKIASVFADHGNILGYEVCETLHKCSNVRRYFENTRVNRCGNEGFKLVIMLFSAFVVQFLTFNYVLHKSGHVLVIRTVDIHLTI